jgi:hypothetical protein
MASPRKHRLRSLVTGALALAGAPLLGGAAATAATTGRAPSGPRLPASVEHTLLHSHELWATIDVCSPPNQRDTVGVRGSMPGDGHAHDAMYMSFRLQYMTASKQWVDIASATNSSWELVGSGSLARQGGSSFALKPVADKPAATLRGVVDFQWRRGHSVLLSAVQSTAAGHKSLAGADPANYSAASCVIG